MVKDSEAGGRLTPAALLPRHNRPASAGSASPAAGCHGSRDRPAQHLPAPAAEPALPLWRKIQRHGEHARMSNGPAIVIDVTREDWWQVGVSRTTAGWGGV